MHLPFSLIYSEKLFLKHHLGWDLIFYLIFFRKQACYKILALAATVILTFAVCWSPFLYHGPQCTLAMLRRLFPVSRGIFEDKVANIWCAVSPVIKFKNVSSTMMLFMRYLNYKDHLTCTSAVATIVTLVPSNVNMIMHPTKERFLYCLISSSFSFFLFHTKFTRNPFCWYFFLFPF